MHIGPFGMWGNCFLWWFTNAKSEFKGNRSVTRRASYFCGASLVTRGKIFVFAHPPHSLAK